MSGFIRHLRESDALRVCIYYGQGRMKYLKELEKYDLVITTYSVVRLDWKTSKSVTESPLTLHTIDWERIVLDEGNINT